jgi:alkylhydroperoxidase/carboxymuconolactone decarboxylase family protein YurZ
MAQNPQAQNPLACLGNLDPELLKIVQETQKMTYGEQPGGLPRKYKLLIAMAIDAAQGAAGGVGNLAKQAMAAGATKQEVGDTLRVVNMICGVGSMHTAAQGLKDMF